jgi:hypothetical protein
MGNFTPRATIALILAICVALVVIAYALGVEAGRAAVARTHPGYGQQ